ncbi:hypothetical protein AB0L40_21470 [Patulibacter sp. NPDC049589]|uniref:hypothetical protein n=1 Tax=Patulibacter sp. NPDC049589 TaxID=3154731 RepID=UPI003426730A
MSRTPVRRIAAPSVPRPRAVAALSPVVPGPGRRARTAALSAGVAAAALLVIPAAASATVTTTNVTSPAPETVFDSSGLGSFLGGIGSDPITVTGTAPGAKDGDEVVIACTYSANGIVAFDPVSYGTVEVHGETFVATGIAPAYTCRLRALPADLAEAYDLPESTDLSAFSGPRVLGGGVAVLTAGEDDGPFPGSPETDGAQIYEAVRGQSRGLVLSTSVATGYYGGGGTIFGYGGGIYASALIEDTYWRLLFGPSAVLGGFGGFFADPTSEDVADAGLLVDGQPAIPTVAVGDKRSKVVSKQTNLANGDLTIVETAPIALVTTDAESGDPTGLADAGLSVERTYRQDHEGRQITVSDVFRSDDGTAHRIEARYGESVYQDVYGDDSSVTKEPASFRIPWATGDGYVTPEAGYTFGAGAPGPNTIFVHGPRQDYSEIYTRKGAGAAARADDGELRRAEGAYTFDAPPTDGRFLSPGAFVVRFVRDIPAGGTTSIKHTYSQDLTPEGLGDLVDGATGGTPPATDPALPATTPLPTQPAPAPPPPANLPKAINPIPLVQRSTKKILFTAAQGRRLRDRKPVTITTKGLPAGRYGITIRRWVKDGHTIASGVKTIKKDGTLKVTLRLTKYGRHYLGLKKTRNRASVKVRVIVTWTPPGKARKKVKSTYSTQFR